MIIIEKMHGLLRYHDLKMHCEVITMKKKRMMLIPALAIILCIILSLVIAGNGLFSWTNFTESKQYGSVVDSTIEKITLKKGISSPEWAVFSDEDLMKQWTEYFESAKIKRTSLFKAADNSNQNGGVSNVVVLTTDTDEFSMVMSTGQNGQTIEIDGYSYDITSSVSCPFDKMYNLAAERHGLSGPWD